MSVVAEKEHQSAQAPSSKGKSNGFRSSARLLEAARMDTAAVLSWLQTSPDGLSPEAAEERL